MGSPARFLQVTSVEPVSTTSTLDSWPRICEPMLKLPHTKMKAVSIRMSSPSWNVRSPITCRPWSLRVGLLSTTTAAPHGTTSGSPPDWFPRASLLRSKSDQRTLRNGACVQQVPGLALSNVPGSGVPASCASVVRVTRSVCNR